MVATPFGIPYLRFEPFVSNLPSRKNKSVSPAFLTEGSFNGYPSALSNPLSYSIHCHKLNCERK